MKQFIAVIHKDADSAFGVHFPDVPGCFSAADTMEDVLPNAVEALTLWFEDQEMIDPRDVAAIRAEAAEDISDGAFLMAVPLILSARKQVRANISIDRGVLEAIDLAAKARGLTRSAFIAEATRNEIEGRH